MTVRADTTYTSEKRCQSACGRCSCVILYSSEHCLLCEAALEVLYEVMSDFGLPKEAVRVVDVMSKEGDGCGLPTPARLPAIQICDEMISGLPDPDVARGAVMQTILRSCFHECEW
jgi:hypothetical protein